MISVYWVAFVLAFLGIAILGLLAGGVRKLARLWHQVSYHTQLTHPGFSKTRRQ